MDLLRKLTGISNPFHGAPVYYIDKTSSTMDIAREQILGHHAKHEDISGYVVAAGFQTEGRGRIPGRVWKAAAGENLTFTQILHNTDTIPGQVPMPLAVGLGLSLYLEEYYILKPEIKWPNDILVKGRKISGIYIQFIKGYYLIGIGINLNQLVFPPEISGTSTSLGRETGRKFDIYKELSLLLLSIYNALHLDNQKYEIEKRLYMKGKEVTFLSGDSASNNRVSGVLSGIGEEGVLVLSSRGNVTTVSAGEMLL